MPENLNDDPVTGKSYGFALLISSFLLVLSLAWALYDEMFGLRPWRAYQQHFTQAYLGFLKKTEAPNQAVLEKAVKDSPQYKKFAEQIQAAEIAATPKVKEIGEESAFVTNRLDALSAVFQDARARVTSRAYEFEVAGSESARESRRKSIKEAQDEIHSVTLPKKEGGTETKSMNFAQLESEFNDLKARRAQLTANRAEARKEVSRLSQEQAAFFKDQMVGLNQDQISKLQRAATNLDISIKQLNISSAGLVDRCQSCHIAMDSKVVPPNLVLTKALLGLGKSNDAPFATHPDMELLKIHDPDRFGCSPCHGGNGRATSSVEKGHGRYEHWLWPLYYPENVQSGCQQCHMADMVVEHAPVLNRGKELYRQRGCIGCHRFEGFDNEGELLTSTRQLMKQLDAQKKDYALEIPRLQKRADDPNTDNDTARKLNLEAANLPVKMSAIDARLEQLSLKENGLMREEKKTGPSLKEVRMKLKKEWIPVWLEKTHDFRPTTKMPQFRLEKDQIQAIAAFIWQSGVQGSLPANPQGNAAKGKEVFETRGCMACHSMGEGAAQLGGDFAANLSRVGEKDNYDYLVRWVHNPRERSLPYCPYEKKDITADDYKKKGLPFVFDLEHPLCPNDGHQLQVQQPTVMPSLRLTIEEARDVASFLVSQKHNDANYAAAPFLDDAKLKPIGRDLVKNYGCAGCHEIATLEDEGRIGTELTTEGSKPVDRLDFARLTEDAKRGLMPGGKEKYPRGAWYDQKGFIEAKLADPAIFDRDRYRPNPLDRLKMPKPNATPADVTALTTFLIGSVDPQLPRDLMYRPDDQRRDIQDGWWLVTKYNCMGCHQIQIGQETKLQKLPRYTGENKDKLPPPLLSEGARVDPNWLARFLENPPLSKTDVNKNGVRSYLQVRMPTFSFSDNEIRKIVRFFEAISNQAQPYLPPKLEALTDAERTMARQLFTHPAAPCLKCHATGVPSHDANASAPNFLLARERLRPAWTARWLTDPAKIAPGTAMPSGLFKREGDRWVFSGPLPPALQSYGKDHTDLLVRYMFQLSPEEQRALVGKSPSARLTPSRPGEYVAIPAGRK
ncbi:MAG: c-type cytochrome [Acidobacteria bacterium]|nr:c-type cytochrome [Acidobacteriota bacterium]